MVVVCTVVLAVLSIRKQHHIESPRGVPSQNVTISQYVPLRVSLCRGMFPLKTSRFAGM